MYNKEIINALYVRYSRHKHRKTLENLIKACDPIADVILATRYRQHFRHHEDIKQEIRLRLWKNLGHRTKESLRLERYVKNPTAYLFFLIRTYAARAFRRLKSVYKESIEISYAHQMSKLSKDSDKD